MSWVSLAEIAAVAGYGAPADILQAAIDDAEAEVTAYLDARGITAASNTVCKLAAKKLAKAGMLEYWVQKGRNVNSVGMLDEAADSRGGFSQEVRQLRDEAFVLLNDYAATQTSLDSPRRSYVVKVN